MPLPTNPIARAESLAKAQAKTAELRATAGDLKQDWQDEDVWQDLAAARGVRLPASYLRPTPTLIRRYCRKLGISNKEFLEWGAYKTVEDFERLNPRWPLRALVGVLLEYAEERDTARKTLRAKLRDEA